MAYDINSEEAKKIIETAYKIKRKKESEQSLNDLENAANDLGISNKDFHEAIDIVHQKTIKRRKMIVTFSIIFVIVGIIVLYNIYENMPKYFSGQFNILFTDKVVNELPGNEILEYNLFYDQSVYYYLSLYDVKYRHVIKWEFYSPDKKLIDTVTLKLKSTGNIKKAWCSTGLNFHSKPGSYNVKIYADNKSIGSKEFLAGYKGMKITLTSDIDSSKNPMNNVTEFSKSKDKKVICYINWERVKGKHIILWKLIAPDNEVKETSNLEMNASDSSYWAYSPYLTRSINKLGKYKFQIFLDSVFLGEKEFIYKS